MAIARGFSNGQQSMTNYDLNLGDTYDIHIAQGIPYTSVDFTWLDANDDPINFTGFTASLRIGLRGYKASLYTYTHANQVDLDTGGVFRFTIPASATANLAGDDHSYDLDLTDSGGTPTRILRGDIICEPNIGTSV